MPIGRNDPCPCGSGKKYKICHGASGRGPAVSPEVARLNSLKTRDTQLTDRLLRFARSRYGPHWLTDVLDSEDLLDDTGDLPGTELTIVIPWLVHYRVDPNGLTLAEAWRREQRRIEPDERLLLEAYHAAWMSVWEVADVEKGRGSSLTDLLTGKQLFVEDVSTTATIERFATLLAVPITCDGVSFFGALHSRPLTPQFGSAMTKAVKRVCRVRTRPVAPEKLRDAEMQRQLIFLWRSAVEQMLNQPPPVLQTTDGDSLVFTRDYFVLESAREAIIPRIAALPGVQDPEYEEGETSFAVTKAGNAMHRSWDSTIIGRIVLKNDKLITETMSTRRADALRATIESELRGLVRFRVRKEENTAELLASARAAARQPRPVEPVPPEAIAEVRRFREQHMKEWLDENIPGLDGLTPREAARLPRARPKLELLLKQLEQSEARLPEQERIDFTWLLETLGFPRLSSPAH